MTDINWKEIIEDYKEDFLEDLFRSLKYILVFQYLYKKDSNSDILKNAYLTPNNETLEIGRLSQIISLILDYMVDSMNL